MGQEKGQALWNATEVTLRDIGGFHKGKGGGKNTSRTTQKRSPRIPGNLKKIGPGGDDPFLLSPDEVERKCADNDPILIFPYYRRGRDVLIEIIK